MIPQAAESLLAGMPPRGGGDVDYDADMAPRQSASHQLLTPLCARAKTSSRERVLCHATRNDTNLTFTGLTF